MSGTFEQARDFFARGVGHYEAGEFVQAEREFTASLALLPGRVSTLTNLGAVRLKLGQTEDAAGLLEEALAQEPDNVEALRHQAAAQAQLGRHEQALATIDRALHLQPTPAGWTLRGSILRTLGRGAEAADAYRAAAAHGGDSELNRFFLASLAGGTAPPHAPREYVESLFDGYAADFEPHLVQVLKYRGPEILVEGLGPAPRFEAALDLGCGTGLCGPLLRPLARQLHGVDLSGKMVERARAIGCYDEVVHADVVDFLQATALQYDLVIAADVFVYIGALEQVFTHLARVLRPGGRCCFSIELAPPGHDVLLQASMRYAHGAGYILKLAQHSGFEISATAERPIREDGGVPIPGLFAWLVRP
jgi:predicted TPR repeat methyltransferase